MGLQEQGLFSFEMGPIRPPNEGQDRSLLIRATRNCPWNRCRFCGTYKHARFQLRSVAEIRRDIDAARALAEELNAVSWSLGRGGKIDNEVIQATIDGNGDIYDAEALTREALTARLQCLANVANWLYAGARTVFLQDADTPVMRPRDLVAVLRYVKESFPSVERITSYARSKTLVRKKLADLQASRQAGLSRVHVGVESGCDEVLALVEKGVTAAEHVRGGLKAREAGISLSAYVMPGLGGRRLAERNALDTAAVLNEMDPDFIRLRTLAVRHSSPLAEMCATGEFELATEEEMVDEIRLLIESLTCSCYLVSDQMSNLLWEVEGILPRDKDAILEAIDGFRALPPMERLNIAFQRRLAQHRAIYGGVVGPAAERAKEAMRALRDGRPDAADAVEDALHALKWGFI